MESFTRVNFTLWLFDVVVGGKWIARYANADSCAKKINLPRSCDSESGSVILKGMGTP